MSEVSLCVWTHKLHKLMSNVGICLLIWNYSSNHQYCFIFSWSNTSILCSCKIDKFNWRLLKLKNSVFQTFLFSYLFTQLIWLKAWTRGNTRFEQTLIWRAGCPGDMFWWKKKIVSFLSFRQLPLKSNMMTSCQKIVKLISNVHYSTPPLADSDAWESTI